ncbi:MAG: acyl-[acyl-carrier-protein] thioesterase [Ruminococcus sp.]|jgi:medium-chain acyl-[acyl-carrier-protein] hydrolase
MKYSFESRVRFSEIGEDRKMTLNSILNYYQDSSNFHSEAAGRGLEKLLAKKRAWILSSWQICVSRYPVMGESIITSTWAYDFKGFYGYRNFTLHTKEGELLSYANSLWIYMNTETKSPAKIEAEEAEGYGMDEKFPMEYASRKVPVPKEGEWGESFTVRRHQLDLNHHVNNGQYIQMAMDYLPENFIVHQMRAEYKKQAVLNSRITPKILQDEGRCTIALCAEDGSPYAVAEFQ